MSDAFDEDGMDVLYALSDVGDDASLSNLPIAVLPIAACLVDAYGDAVEVEVGQLSVTLSPEIDAAISEKAVGWTIERMGKADLAIIRLAVYEIMFDDDIPVSVSINEAVELAKKYGRDESGGFVNGVLAKFAK